ncbi:bifunctional riboflavin kinase/FAD synthetase [Hathewaya limosa]|uniref:Riboflavin biosynthesis protein n=1 Tax=Hathewaya limosa TaxID=1536 RepID=A0ABU0JSR5_HATLI|nr:bifunctional riboflavin kinase/FAD synthetase [Hathewaya limosa]MDQ0480136.1 riboflavin kinase/FMN adenylyltransferase [Hathewaya limosa]
MVILEDNFNKKLQYDTYIALGSFDGLHLGHLSLVRKVVELSKKNKCKSMIYTFKNHPMSLVNSEKIPKLLQSKKDKVRIFKNEGIDIVNFATFNLRHMKMQPEQFVCRLVNYYNVKGIVVGFNYRFGYKNLGTIELLQDFSEKYNFELYVCPPITFEEKIVSSTFIRNLIKEGNVEKARLLLNKPYSIEGEIIEGKKIGRQIGFPTINLSYKRNFALPKRGVYYTIVEYEKKLYRGITNIGFNPTVNGNNLSVETNIIDFSKEIYGESVKLFFIEKLRDEKKFNSLEQLKQVLTKDKISAKEKELKL